MSHSQPSAAPLTIEQLQKQVAVLPVNDRYGTTKWKNALDRAVPGWQALVSDPANHPSLVHCRPKTDRNDLMQLFVDTAGWVLAEAWLNAGDSEAKRAAEQWFANNLGLFSQFSNHGKDFIAEKDEEWLIDRMTPEVWQYLSSAKRQRILQSIWSVWHHMLYTQIMHGFSLYLHGITLNATALHHAMQHYYLQPWLDDDDCDWSDLYRHYRHYRHYYDYHFHRHGDTAPQSLGQALRRTFQIPWIQEEPTKIKSVAKLLHIIEQTQDLPSSEYWERLRGQNKAMMAALPKYMTPDTVLTDGIPPPVQSWLHAKQKLLVPGAVLPPWPKIVVSDDDPPLFKIDPFYKQMYEEDYLGGIGPQEREREQHRERGQKYPRERGLDRVNIEGQRADTERLLGCYYFDRKQIVLWRKGIELCAMGLAHPNGQGKGFPIEDLALCVLVHELGHWFNAEAITPYNIAWDRTALTLSTQARQEEIGPLDPYALDQPPPATLTGHAYALSSRAYHEAWAQLFAWLYGQEQNLAVLKVFEALERHQSTPYHAWRQLVNADPDPGPGPYGLSDLRWPQTEILNSLEWSRGRRDSATGTARPATFSDANFPATSMLAWLRGEQKPVCHTFTFGSADTQEPEEEPVIIDGRYRDHGDGTLTDTVTGLHWMRRTLGQRWESDDIAGAPRKYDWPNALTAVKRFNQRGGHAGKRDWRLPTIEELKTLIHCSTGRPKTWNDSGHSCGGQHDRPTLSHPAFGNKAGGWCWSASAEPDDHENQWMADFTSGYVGRYGHTLTAHVRLVRDTGAT